MPYIKVDIGKIKGFQQELSNIGRNVTSISDRFLTVRQSIDSDIKNSSGIERKLQSVGTSLSAYKNALSKKVTFLNNTSSKYAKADSPVVPITVAAATGINIAAASVPPAQETTPEEEKSSDGKKKSAFTFLNGDAELKPKFEMKGEVPPMKKLEDKINDYFEKKKVGDHTLRKEDKTVTYKKKNPDAKDGDPKYVKVDEKDAPKFYDREQTLLEVGIGGALYGNLIQLGDREDTDGDGTYGYIAVGEGEIHGSLTAGLYVLNGDGKRVFSPGVSAEVGASVSLIHGEGQWQALGDENFGLNLEGEFSLGKAEAKAGAEVQIFGEDGKLKLQASAEAKAEAIAAEVEGSIGLNVLGGEVEVKGGVNFGVGAHAEIGIKDGVIKCDVGVSLGLGVSLAVEVDVGGMVSTVCEAATSIWEGTKSVVSNIFKGW